MYLAKAAAVLKALFSPCGNLASGKADSSLMKNPCIHAPDCGQGGNAAVIEVSTGIEALPKIAGLGNQLPRETFEKQLRKQRLHPHAGRFKSEHRVPFTLSGTQMYASYGNSSR
jgi:hypothetical protein